MFQKRNITVGIWIHFRIQEWSYIPVSLGIYESTIFGKVWLALNSAQFTTVPKHDSWEALTEDNTQKCLNTWNQERQKSRYVVWMW